MKLNGSVSSWSNVQGGIPQGSALGPLLFLVYVNDMPSIVENGKLLQFADDTTLICTGTDIDSVKKQLSLDLSLVYNWISASRLQLNIKKSSVMWFTPKPSKNVSHPTILVNNTQLHEVDHQKYLGIIFDTKLCWDSQVNDVCKRVAYYLHLLNVHRNSLTFSILKLLSESLIFSRITYALPVWGPPLRKDQISRLQRMQNRAVRITKSLRKSDHVSAHRKDLCWLSIPDMIQLQSVAAMYHYYKRKEVLKLDPPIVFGRQHSYDTRCGDYFANICSTKLCRTRRYFRTSATSSWNSLHSTEPFPDTLTCSMFVNYAKSVYLGS